MKCRIEGPSGLEHAERDMDELAHHGADDDFGRLAVSHQTLTKAFAPVGFVEGDESGHVEGAAQEGMADLGQAGFTRTLLPDSWCFGLRPAKAVTWRALVNRSGSAQKANQVAMLRSPRPGMESSKSRWVRKSGSSASVLAMACSTRFNSSASQTR
jgi:hypothetical protein